MYDKFYGDGKFYKFLIPFDLHVVKFIYFKIAFGFKARDPILIYFKYF